MIRGSLVLVAVCLVMAADDRREQPARRNKPRNEAGADAQPEPSYRKGALTKDEPQAIYAADADDPWNRIFYCLFTRTIKARVAHEFSDAGECTELYVDSFHKMSLSTRSFERIEPGDRAVEALYPAAFTGARPEGAVAVLTEPRFAQLRTALTDALKEETPRPPLARALMQSDAWAAYDVLHRYCVGNRNADQARGAALMALLARLIKKLALTPSEIADLPDNYAAAVRAGDLHDLFGSRSKWLEVEWLTDRLHDHTAHFRHVARVFVKPADAPRDKQAFVNDLPKNHAGLLDSVALVNQLLLIDTNGKAVPTRLAYEVQLRMSLQGRPRLAVQELSRRLLLGNPRSSGLVVYEDRDPSYLRMAGNDYSFASQLGLSRAARAGDLVSVEPVLVTQRQLCSSCHGDNAQAVLTFPGLQDPGSAPAVKLLNPSANDRGRLVAQEKAKRADFKALQQQWGK